jgi:hypothetical protein
MGGEIEFALPDFMDEYDRKAWGDIQQWKARRLGAKTRRAMPGSVRKGAAAVGRAVRTGGRAVPRADQFQQTFEKAMEALVQQGLDVALASVRTKAVLASYRRAGHTADRLDDIRVLDLRTIDAVKPNLALGYASVAMVEGAGAGLAVTGSEVLTVTGAGPALVVGAVTADAAASLMGSLRLVAHTAAYYGFDVARSEEHMMRALGVLGVGVAVGANKAAAYRELSRVTQQLARRGIRTRVWEAVGGTGKLPRSPVTKLVVRVLTQFGFKASARNVEKLLPVIGIGLGAGSNAALMRRVAAAADVLWREQWLIERYGITLQVPEAPADGEAVDIAGLMDEVVDEVEVEVVDVVVVEDEVEDEDVGGGYDNGDGTGEGGETTT